MQTIKKISYTLLFVLTLTLISASPAFASFAITDGSVIFLDHGDGTDATGNFTETPSNMASASGKFGAGLSFNGTSARILITTSTGTNSFKGLWGDASDVDLTIGTWTYITNAQQQMFLAMKSPPTGCSSPFGRFRIGAEANDKARFEMEAAGANNLDDPGAMTEDAWHFVVATIDNETHTMRLYVDGSEVNNVVAGALDIENWPVYLGDMESCGNWFAGTLDDTFILKKTLSASDIASIWNSGVGQELALVEESVPGGIIRILNPTSTSVLHMSLGYTRTQTYIATGTPRAIVYFATSAFSNAAFQSPANAYMAIYPVINSTGTSTQNTALTKSLYTGTTTIWYEKAELYSEDWTVFYGSSTISFTIASDIYENFSTSTLANIFTPEVCADVGFFSSSTLSQIGCEFRNALRFTGSFLFVPHTPFQNIVTDGVSEFKNTFPFVFVFGTGDLVREKIASASSTALDIQIQLSGNSKSATTTITLFSSSTMTNGFGSNFVNAYSNFVLTSLATIMVVAMIVLIGL